MNLYELSIAGQEMQRILEESVGELTPELESALDMLLSEGKNSVEAAAMIVRGLEASWDACHKESERLALREVSYDRQASILKERILWAVDSAFGGKVKTEKFTIWGQTSADTVGFEVAPDADLKEMPEITRTTYALDKIKLKAMVQNNEPIPAAVTVTHMPGKRSLRIK